MLDLDTVRRQVWEGGKVARVELRIAETVRVVILAFAPSEFLSATLALRWRGQENAPWLMLTEGRHWMIFRPDDRKPAYEEFYRDDPQAVSRLIDDLRLGHHLRLHFLNGPACDRDQHVLEAELLDLLSESHPFASEMAERLERKGLNVLARDVAASVQAMLEARTGLLEPRHPQFPCATEDAEEAIDSARPPTPVNTDAPWPAGASHKLARKGYASFIRFDAVTGHATLLPGSVMRAKTGRSFPAYHRRLREDALSAGLMRSESDFLRVAAGFTLENPTAAATFVSGTVENGWKAWRDVEGNPISRVLEKVPRRLSPRREQSVLE